MLSFMEKKASAVKLAEWSPSDWPESLPEMRVIWYKYLHHCVQKCSWLDKFHFFSFIFQAIDNLLRCSICYEFFDVALIVPECSHNCKLNGSTKKKIQ